MDKEILLEGTTVICGETVDFKVTRNTGDDVKTHYEWDINPYLVDVNQMGPHRGEVNRGVTLDELYYRFNQYRNEIKVIREKVPNPNF